MQRVTAGAYRAVEEVYDRFLSFEEDWWAAFFERRASFEHDDAYLRNRLLPKEQYAIRRGTGPETFMFPSYADFIHRVRRMYILGTRLYYERSADEDREAYEFFRGRLLEFDQFFYELSSSGRVPAPQTPSVMTPAESRFCQELLTEVQENPISREFLQPVSDAVRGYRDIVATPIDYGTIARHFALYVYTNLTEFLSDCSLVSFNCLNYNLRFDATLHQLRRNAIELLRLVHRRYSEFSKTAFPDSLFEGLEVLERLVEVPADRVLGGLCRAEYFWRADKRRPTLDKVLEKVVFQRYESREHFFRDLLETSLSQRNVKKKDLENKRVFQALNDLFCIAQSMVSSVASASQHSASSLSPSPSASSPAASAAVAEAPAPFPIALQAGFSKERCREILNRLYRVTVPMQPYKLFDTTAEQLEELSQYRERIRRTVTFKTILAEIPYYSDFSQFREDMELVFTNCFTYNPDILVNMPIRLQCQAMKEAFDAQSEGAPPGMDRRRCYEILESLKSVTVDVPIYTTFYNPVGREIKNYYQLIERPICFCEIEAALEDGTFKSMKDFIGSVDLLLKNAKKFNRSICNQLLLDYTKMLNKAFAPLALPFRDGTISIAPPLLSRRLLEPIARPRAPVVALTPAQRCYQTLKKHDFIKDLSELEGCSFVVDPKSGHKLTYESLDLEPDAETLKKEIRRYFDLLIQGCDENHELKKKRARLLKEYFMTYLKVHDPSNQIYRRTYYENHRTFIHNSQIRNKNPMLRILKFIQKTPKYTVFFNEIDYSVYKDYRMFIPSPKQYTHIFSDLKANRYSLYGQVINDLFLVLDNALEYNKRNKEDPHSVYQLAEQFRPVLEDLVYKASLDIVEIIQRYNLNHNISDGPVISYRTEVVNERAQKFGAARFLLLLYAARSTVEVNRLYGAP